MLTPILHGVSALVSHPHQFSTTVLSTWSSDHAVYVDLMPDPFLTLSYFSRLFYTTCCSSPVCRCGESWFLRLRQGLSVAYVGWASGEDIQNARILEGPGKKGSFTIQVLVTSSILVSKF